MNIKKLEERAKYYERLTRQYREAQDFLQALRYDSEEIASDSIGNSKLFDKCNEIAIQTPAIIKDDYSTTKAFYKVNLVKDLGMEATNKRVTEFLIDEVKRRIAEIKAELESVFGCDEEIKNEL